AHSGTEPAARRPAAPRLVDRQPGRSAGVRPRGDDHLHSVYAGLARHLRRQPGCSAAHLQWIRRGVRRHAAGLRTGLRPHRPQAGAGVRPGAGIRRVGAGGVGARPGRPHGCARAPGGGVRGRHGDDTRHGAGPLHRRRPHAHHGADRDEHGPVPAAGHDRRWPDPRATGLAGQLRPDGGAGGASVAGRVASSGPSPAQRAAARRRARTGVRLRPAAARTRLPAVRGHAVVDHGGFLHLPGRCPDRARGLWRDAGTHRLVHHGHPARVHPGQPAHVAPDPQPGRAQPHGVGTGEYGGGVAARDCAGPGRRALAAGPGLAAGPARDRARAACAADTHRNRRPDPRTGGLRGRGRRPDAAADRGRRRLRRRARPARRPGQPGLADAGLDAVRRCGASPPARRGAAAPSL
ncbi:MAG: hypothetical protein AVDCRST_MAG51-2806, partial [uncultured Ramlibacter sp.]